MPTVAAKNAKSSKIACEAFVRLRMKLQRKLLPIHLGIEKAWYQTFVTTRWAACGIDFFVRPNRPWH